MKDLDQCHENQKKNTKKSQNNNKNPHWFPHCGHAVLYMVILRKNIYHWMVCPSAVLVYSVVKAGLWNS